jgi:hypothetical protein
MALGSRASVPALPTRLFALILGLGGIAWGATTFPLLWQHSLIEGISTHIIDRNTFKVDALTPLMPEVAATEQAEFCRPEALRGAAVIRLRLAEEALMDGKRAIINGQLISLQDAIRHSLACSPTDPFLWVVLAWVENAREGFKPNQLQYIRLSYESGPNEGWVAVRRNRLALAIYERLPPDLADAATVEFARMIDSWLFDDTISIFTGPGWRIRDKLLKRIETVSARPREGFAKSLYEQGYDVAIPGITLGDPRPWH